MLFVSGRLYVEAEMKAAIIPLYWCLLLLTVTAKPLTQISAFVMSDKQLISLWYSEFSTGRVRVIGLECAMIVTLYDKNV